MRKCIYLYSFLGIVLFFNSALASNTQGPKSFDQYVQLEGKRVEKKRVKGKVVSKTTWDLLPSELSIHSTEFQELRISKNSTFKNISSVDIIFRKKKEKYFKKSFKIDSGDHKISDFDFKAFALEYIGPKEGILEFNFINNKKQLKSVVVRVVKSGS
ncbi:MAG: hypothetical protein GY909_16690 [Oligoflexia bacterium]|nr:hypothetical protein [Oligoflexia bacterium]